MQFDNKGFTPVKMDDLGFTPVQFDSRGFTPVKLPEHEDQGVPDSPFTLISGVSLTESIYFCLWLIALKNFIAFFNIF